ncbi:hypothetical protein NHX12_017713 [Muraenolepis orangiensis]|uniref:MAPK regulated corepressor interacting protein 2-like n=1 Tax=Muraenolepis orangiensis TaxID=630683 RepID=A0A9Q0EV47_9TELE|nr:hypothetical protein NHX12_017713 [Muraenolepis orangiensis]
MYAISRGPSKRVTQRRTAWQDVEQRLEDGEQRLEDGEQKCREPTSVPVKYSEETTGAMVKSKESGPTVNNFVPIDLDEWWAQRFLANIANQP